LIGLAGFLVILAVGLLILWINSRAQFMFIEGIANNTCEVTAISMVVMVVILGAGVLLAWQDIQARTFGNAALTAIVVSFVLFLPAVIIFALIYWCTQTFITTIMYSTGQTVLLAWDEFRHYILPGNVGKFILFLLMQIVLAIAVGILQLLIGCITCCIGLLPYLSTVITLPLVIFMRAYPIYFLQQFGPRYTIIFEPPAGYGFPVGPPPIPPPPASY
jgi:hypothetical protein